MRAWMPLLATALLACAPKNPRVSYVTVASQVEDREMPYAVYTPPGWDGETPLPLVVFLHGGGDDHTVLDKHPVVPNTLDAWIEEGRIPPILLVAPNGEKGFWRNWADGSHRFADWVMDEVVADVRARYPVLPEPDGQHIMGISMGGAGSVYMGLDHLDRLASISAFSGPIFSEAQTLEFLENPGFVGRIAPFERVFGPPDPERISQENAYARTGEAADLAGTDLLIGVGTVDMAGLMKSNRAFHEHLVANEVPHDFIVYRGGHRWVDWARLFPVALCLRLRGEACELPASSFYTLERYRP